MCLEEKCVLYVVAFASKLLAVTELYMNSTLIHLNMKMASTILIWRLSLIDDKGSLPVLLMLLKD